MIETEADEAEESKEDKKTTEDLELKRLEELCSMIKSVGDLKGKAEPILLNNHLCNRVTLPEPSKEESKEIDLEQR